MSWGWRRARHDQLGPAAQVFPSQGRQEKNQSQQDVFGGKQKAVGLVSSCPMRAEVILVSLYPGRP